MKIMSNITSWVILFGGAGRHGVIERLHSENFKISHVIVPKKRNERLNISIERIAKLNLPIVEVDKSNLVDSLKPTCGEALLSLGFPMLISAEILSRFVFALNVHPTLLPKYRGPNSGAYVLMNDEKLAGSTVHLMTDKIDQGPIITQSNVPVSKFDTLRSMQRKVYESEPNLVIEALKLLETNTPMIQQLEEESSLYGRRFPMDSEIDPNKPLLSLFDEIRSCDPEDFPAHFFIQGEKVCIRFWRPDKPSEEFDLI
jgi:methionyl-tRNA formyltransferase